jgi:DNA replication and repair protein RecF
MALATPAERAGSADVQLTRLTLHDFRSYAGAELQPDPGLTVVAGPNGAGKTNLLEAIFATVTGRSHRASSDVELVRHGADFARVRLDLDGGTGPRGSTVELLVPGATPPAGLRKRWSVNGVARRASSIGDVVRAVLFRPEEMLLLVGSPGERRRFLDTILAQRDRRMARDLADLARIVAQRSALLRAIRAEEASLDSLAFWDEQLAQVGARVMAGRLHLVAELNRRIGPLHDAVAMEDESEPRVGLGYVDSLKEAWPARGATRESPPDATTLVEPFRQRIADVRQKEAWNGVSLVGPQRDDVRAELAGRDVAVHASRGQQRTIILALKLAETELLAEDGPRPIVLLDDVFSELDPRRAHGLAELLLGRGQVIVTTADEPALDAAGLTDASAWRIEGGQLMARGR